MTTIKIVGDNGTTAQVNSPTPTVFKVDGALKGSQGNPGPPGATPTISVGSVSTLPAGSPATVTISGTAAAPVLNFAIPQGSSNINNYTVVTAGNAQANMTGSGLSALTGNVNGTNTAFTVPGGKYAASSLEVYLNGVYQPLGDAINTTTPTSGVFTFVTAPATGDQIYVRYQTADLNTVTPGGGGVTSDYVDNRVATQVASALTPYAKLTDVQAAVVDRQTALQVSNTVDQKIVQYQNTTAFKMNGGNPNNYLGPTTPTGTQDGDWSAVGSVLSNANGSLWLKTTVAAQTPTTTPNVAYDAKSELLLAETGYKAMNLTTESVPTDNASPATSSSGAFARALTMAVLARDQNLYTAMRDSLVNKLYRGASYSGQTTLLNSFGRTINLTANSVSDWGVNAGDQLQIMGAMIRAWNLWGLTKDKDLASGLAYDIKNYLVNTDEGRAYLVMDDQQKLVTNGHHLDGGNPVWANDLGKISPVIFRMAKTFTGDTIFDQLVNGYYDLLNKATVNSGNLATTTGLPPHYLYYKAADHTVGPIVNGQHGWTQTLVSDTDQVALQTIWHVYEDYKTFNETRAQTYLTGNVLTFFKNLYDTNHHIYTVYSHTGTAQNSLEDAFTYRTLYLLLSLATTGTTAATMKADRIPYPTAVSGSNHYYNNQIIGATAASSRDGDMLNWLAESMIAGLYPDIAIYGSNPNVGTTAPAGTTPVSPGTPGSTTPPASTGVTTGAFYSYGAAPNLTQSQRQTIARGEYDKFKSLCFVNYHCSPDGTNQVTLPDGQWRVMNPIDQFNGGQSGLRATVSEGIAYGMMATVFMGNPSLPTGVKDTGAQTMFDGFWKYYKRYMNSNGLMNWCIKSDGSVNATGGATDGDLDAAFALVMAHRIWGSTGSINYGQEAVTLITAIRDKEFVPTSGHPNPNYMCNGDQWGFDNVTYFPDYFAPGWMREFYKHTGDTRWLDIINANYPVAQGSFYDYGSGTVPAGTPRGNTVNTNGLITDINRSGNRASDPILGYNDVRYPWRIAADFCWNGTNTNVLAHDAPARMVARAKVVLGTNPTAASPTGDGKYNPYSGTSGIVAEPGIDYSYWNGSYRNSTYVQAYGVAGVVDAAHSDWAAACMSWLQADTEQNYFGRGLSCMATLLMSGIMNPGTPASTGTTTTGTTGTGTTTTPVTVTTPTDNTPVGAVSLFANPNTTVANYRDTLSAGTKKDRFAWQASVPMAFWSGIDWDPDCTAAKAVIDGAAAAGKVAQVLSYSIPGRDLGQYSAGGAANRTAYQTWIGKLATAIGTRKVILAYEPDSLPQSDSLPDDQRTGRYAMMSYAIKYLKQNCPNLWLYVDCGHSAWRSVQDAANLLHQVNVENANGFVINISNFRPDAETITYGQQVAAALNLPNMSFVYDSGRNGGNPPETWQYANPASRQFGKLPQFGNTGIDKCDGWLWWKIPGESDGNNSDSYVGETAPAAGAFYAKYLYNDSVGDNVTTGVVATSSGMLQRPPTPGVTVQGAHI